MTLLENLEQKIAALIEMHKAAQEQISSLSDECFKLHEENERLLRLIDSEKMMAASLSSESEALKQSIDKLIHQIDGLGC